MNMLVERGRVPITPANDEQITAQANYSADSQAGASDDQIDQYAQLRTEACAINVFEWQMKQLEVAAVIGIGPPRSL